MDSVGLAWSSTVWLLRHDSVIGHSKRLAPSVRSESPKVPTAKGVRTSVAGTLASVFGLFGLEIGSRGGCGCNPGDLCVRCDCEVSVFTSGGSTAFKCKSMSGARLSRYIVHEYTIMKK